MTEEYQSAEDLSSVEESVEEEQTPEEQVSELLAILQPPTVESVLAGEPFPEWFGQSWAAALVDPHDPDHLNAIAQAKAWLVDH